MNHQEDSTHHAHADHPDHSHQGVQEGLRELLDLDAEVFVEQLQDVRDDIGRLSDSAVRSILDLGAGTGTGTFGLLRHFDGARVLAVDASDEMLEHVRREADLLGLADRVTTLLVDLDVALPRVEPVDLAWASASLHHLADPDRTLAQVVTALRPGGLLAVIELTGFPRFLPDDAPGGAAEARAQAVLDSDRAADLPEMDADWVARLSRAGMLVEMDRTIRIDLAPPLAPVVREYAAATLRRVREAVADRLDAVDRQALDVLLDDGPGDVRRRSDLRVRTERQVCIARRPLLA